MTPTQPTEFTNEHGRTLRIESDGVRIVTPEREMAFFFDTPEQAQRSAPAILTGPGKVDVNDFTLGPVSLSNAARYLTSHFAALDARAAADAEAAELRAEALAILKEAAGIPFAEWLDFSEHNQTLALRAAKAERAIRSLDADAEARWLHTNKETQHG